MIYLLYSLTLFASFSLQRIEVPLLNTIDPTPSTTIVWPEKFHFLAKGHQVFVFESEDKQFVLKFFDREQFEESWVKRLFGTSKNKERRLKERIEIYPVSYQLAFEWFRKETALLAVHQGTSSVKYPIVSLIENGQKFEIDLNTIPFVLQKKVESSLPSLLAKAKQEKKLTHLIDQFLDIHRQRISIQIGDYDRNIRDNYGWDGKRLIYLDPARLHMDNTLLDPTLCYIEWRRVTDPIRKWLKQNAVDELALFDRKIEQFLAWQNSKEIHHANRTHCRDFENCPYFFNRSCF